MKNQLLPLMILALSSLTVGAQPSATSANPAAHPKADSPAGKRNIVLPPEKSQPVKLPRFEKAPLIDGKLDDEVWTHAVVLKDFYQVQPGDNIAPSKPTEVLLGYDSKFLYIAFHCYDEPDKVRATIPKRDNVWNDDYVGILFDTFNDSRKAYEFDFNPLGVQADGTWTDQNEDFNPDFVFESKGTLTTDGWTLEVAIPFKSLRYVAGKDKLWGAHFFRRIKRFNNELDMWMPLNRDNSSWLAQEGHLSGLEGISTERTLELIPSLTLSETGKRKATLTPDQVNAGMKDPGRFVNEPVKFDPGLTGKFSITPNVTLDFAINPDFAQVESDQLVVTANQRFPIFFSEKRPFFLEGIDIFNTQIAAVHTRAIIDPDYAVKLTGKVDRNTFGLLLASDNGPGNFSPEDRLTADPRFVDKNASVGILRLKHDIGKQDSFIGLLATYRRFVDQYNELGGFDSRLRVNKSTTFSAQALATHSRRNFFYPDLGQTLDRKENGFIYATDLNMSGRHLGYDYSTVGRTRYYRADVGFNRRTNTCTFWGNDNERSASNGGVYVFASSTVNKKINFNVFADQNYGSLDFDFGAGSRYPRASIPAVAAREAQAAGKCNGATPPPVCNAPLDPGPGKSFNLNGNVNYTPLSALYLTLNFTKQRLRRNDTHLLAFDENIVSLRATYQFTRFVFARGRIDFDSLRSNYRGQFLFGWTPKPGTAFYIGYNDDINRNGFSPFTGQIEPGFRRNGRTFFIKMSYLFRKSF